MARPPTQGGRGGVRNAAGCAPAGGLPGRRWRMTSDQTPLLFTPEELGLRPSPPHSPTRGPADTADELWAMVAPGQKFGCVLAVSQAVRAHLDEEAHLDLSAIRAASGWP